MHVVYRAGIYATIHTMGALYFDSMGEPRMGVGVPEHQPPSGLPEGDETKERSASAIERASSRPSTVVPSVRKLIAATSVPTPKPIMDPVRMEIEHALSDGMYEYYAAMPPAAQHQFKMQGEELARTITTMVQSLHFEIMKVAMLIKKWLMMIPGVSPYFLEQEAKIRADKVATIARFEAERTKGPHQP